MSDVKWTIKGQEFVNCNCDYGCPCQFSANPTHGDCRAVAMFRVDEGRHGNTKLDGLAFGMIAKWPGAIHEGHGEITPIVDEKASPEQREAILRIMSGEDTEPGATVFQVFSTTMEKVHDPIFTRINFELDVDGRMATLNVPGLIESRGESLANQVTGEPLRSRINLPEGFEYDTCEVARGWTETHGEMAFSLTDTHAHLAKMNMTQRGVAHHA